MNAQCMRNAAAVRQRGAATLVVVMVLFFIMALAAVAAGRNQLFDSRIAANYARAELATSTAEAGYEWLTAMLNGGLIDTSCLPATSGPDTFAARYFTFSGARQIAPRYPPAGATNGSMCYHDSGSWTCQCAQNGSWTAPSTVSGTQPNTPTFNLQFGSTERPGILVAVNTTCTDATSNACLIGGSTGVLQLGFIYGAASLTSHQDYVLISALKVPPASPLIVQGAADWGPSGSSLALQNADTASHGVLAQVGGPVSGSTGAMLSLPGTPADSAIISDTALAASSLPWDSFFQRYFGMWPATYQQQPAVRTVAQCPASSDCTPLVDALVAAGHRMIWIKGAATFNTSATWGSTSSPIVLIVDGSTTIAGDYRATGMVAVNGAISLTNTSGSSTRFVGAMIATGSATFSGGPQLAYSPTVLRQIADRMGSYVRLPGALVTDRNT